MTEMIEPMPAQIDQQQLAQELVDRAREEGVELVGPGGPLTGLSKTVLETALEAETTEHLVRFQNSAVAVELWLRVSFCRSLCGSLVLVDQPSEYWPAP